jgi:hypothetical protein
VTQSPSTGIVVYHLLLYGNRIAHTKTPGKKQWLWAEGVVQRFGEQDDRGGADEKDLSVRC